MKNKLRPGKPVRVFIAESSNMACQLMARALQQSGRLIRVVGSATESGDILKCLIENPFDVAIVSADLKDGPAAGFQVARDVRTSYPHARLIVLVHSADRAMIIEGFRAGADGVFPRDEAFEMLCKCIHAVHRGQIWARSEQLRFIVQEAMANGEERAIKNVNGTKLLTKREEELAQFVSEGLTNRDISNQLHLSEHTVRNYLFRIFNKLGTSNRLELALYVIKQRGDRGSHLSRSFVNGSSPESSQVQSIATAAPKLRSEPRRLKIDRPPVRADLKLEIPHRSAARS